MISNNRNENSSADILTLAEIAEYLKIGRKSVLRMAQEGEIPGAKIGGQWRFLMPVIEQWLTERMYRVSRSDLYDVIATAGAVQPLSRLIRPETIVPEMASGDRREILVQLLSPLKQLGAVKSIEPILARLIEREEMASTAIAPGVAFPHPRQPSEVPVSRPWLVLGRCPQGTAYGSLNGGPTHLFFLILAGRDDVHLRLMAKTALLTRNAEWMERLRAADDAQTLHQVLFAADEALIRGLP